MTTTDQSGTPTASIPVGEERLLVDGELVDSTGGRRFETVNPATEEVLGHVADASGPDMDRAIGAAQHGGLPSAGAPRPPGG